MPSPSPPPGFTGAYAPDPDAQETLAPPSIPDATGTWIGPYKLLQKIGEGGMGTVYLAEQNEPVRRRVALKIIKPGMDSSQVIARFEIERQALALMDHPNIARVLDAGTAQGEPGGVSAGRPYFVMELVQGVPLTDYCDKAHLSPRERLELFVPVCLAIQHAHQKGIIHRDIKPSNILVSLTDGHAVPKVIDFGVAKATEQRLTERTMFTHYGAVVGTFEYMSPEQAEMSPLGIDTRSDIYSLGVVLYELLTGTTPLEARHLRDAGYPGLVMLIVEQEPPKPSTRLSSSNNLSAIAAARKTEPTKLTKLVKGELDWIVMKCLEKVRTRRYESASGLAQDIERYLNDEPVQACPPSAGYRLRKFLRRNWGKVMAAAALLFTLLAGTLTTSIAMFWAMQSRQSERIAWQQANAVDQVVVQDLYEAANYWANPDPDIKFRPVLDNAVRRLEGNPRGNLTPNVEQAARMAFARAYLGVAEYQEARRHAQRAWELGRRYGEKHIDTVIPMLHVAVADRYLGEYARAEPVAERALELTWPFHPNNDLLMLEVVSLRAVLHDDLGKPEEAERLLARSLDECRSRYGEDSFQAVVAYGELLRFLYMHNKPQQAEPLSFRALEAGRRNSEQVKNPQRHGNYLFLAGCCKLQLGQAAEAERLFRQSLAIGGQAGPDFGRDYLTKTRLGAAVLAQKRYAESEPLLLEGYGQVKQRRTTPYWEKERDEALQNLINLYEAWEKKQEADKWRKELEEVRKPASKPPTSP